jgi:hypothetical protein
MADVNKCTGKWSLLLQLATGHAHFHSSNQNVYYNIQNQESYKKDMLINNHSGAVLENLIGPWIVKKFPSIYGTQWITTTNCPCSEPGGQTHLFLRYNLIQGIS